MTLSDISIRNPVFAWMLMLGLILFGAISYSRMGVSQMPDVDFPVVNIAISYEGASPEIMETDVIDVIEDQIMSVEGVREVTSVARQSNASITVELDIDRDVDVALQEINTKVAQAQRLLPSEMEPPIITKRNPEDFPIVWLAVSSTGSLRDLMVYARHSIKDKFQTIPGVAEVKLGGYVDRNLRIWIDREKLFGYELAVGDVISTIGREHVEVPGGRIETSEQETVIRSMGEAGTVKLMSELPITSRGSQPVFRRILLRDIADIEDGLDDVRRLSRFNGQMAVGLGIMKQRGSNAVDVAHRVKDVVRRLKTTLPPGYTIEISNDQTRFIEDATGELVFTIILSCILTGIVCFLFLGSFSSTVNILLAIPTSLLGTFIVLYFMGYTLNTFTLLALSLVVGIVVDDSIMVLENITRHREEGKSRIEAAIIGARQITSATAAASLAVIAIFLPVAFMSGIIGKFFLQFGVTVSVAVLLSLVEALTLTPMRCSQFLEAGEQSGKVSQAVNRVFVVLSAKYQRLLGWTLDHRAVVLGTALLFFAASLYLLVPVKKEFVPVQDQSMFLLSLKTNVGSSLNYTDEMTKKVERYLAPKKEILKYYSAVGGFTGGEVNTAIMFVTMKDPENRPIDSTLGRRLTQQEFVNSIRKGLNSISRDLRVTIMDLSMRGLTPRKGFPVELIVKGSDWNQLGTLSLKVAERMAASGKCVDVDTSYDLGQPELQIIPDRAAAELRGISMASIGETVGVLMGGRKTGKFTEGGHRYDIRLRLKETDRNASRDISRLYVRNNRGELVRLSDVAKIKETSSLLSITRVNRARSVFITANPAPGYSQQDAVNESLKIAREVLPGGYEAEITGAAKTTRDSFTSLLFALVLGIVVAYMVLASQYNSYIHPLTILMALPFSFSGAIIALLIFGQSLNMFSFIGLILLMGIVKKNSIMLVEFTNQMREKGLGVRESLLSACPVRLRPIMMTSLATIAAAIPPALALGPGAESRIPMAVAVLGGMVFSTVLTLFVVPCVYSIMSRFEVKGKYEEEQHTDISAKT